jgi:hypothetical protein
MKRSVIFFLLLGLASTGLAQKVHFVYLQTDKGNPFFVRVGEKILSSTSQGYLIMANLQDSTYTLQVGIPGEAVIERKFQVEVNGKDRGLLLKDMGTQWNLFDLQTMQLIEPVTEEKKQEPVAYRTDEFSKKLALAVDDPSLLFIYASAPAAPAIVQANEQQEKKTDDAVVTVVDKKETVTEQPKSVTPDSAVAVNDPTSKTNVVDTTVTKEAEIPEEPYVRSKVRRRSESSTTEGFGLVFVDEQNGQVDTIRILIPNPPVIYKTEADRKAETEYDSGTRDIQKEVRQLPAVTDTLASSSNPACIAMGSESDFKKLRRDMVSKDNEEEW